jgi:hypothetical protein
LYAPLLDHPVAVVKLRVFSRLLNEGGEAARERALDKVRELLASGRGTDWFLSLSMEYHYNPASERAQ